MDNGKIIGIFSSMPQQGKSEIRKYLVEKHGFRHLPFARVLKRMVMVFLVEHGYPEPVALEYIEKDKEVPLERVSGMPTTRWLMQTLGTQWGRHEISPTLWVDEWELKARAWSRSGVGVVADDMRFPNEMEAVRRLGGSTWRVERPDLEIDPEVLKHASEGNLSSATFDEVINNNGTIADLRRVVDIAAQYPPARARKKS